VKEYYAALKQRAVLVLEHVSGKDRAAEIEKVEAALMKIMPPKDYAAEEIEMVRAYERSCALMSQRISRNPKELTVLEFYETLEALKIQNKKQNTLNGQPH